jgi:calcineurin-like phosphoesterase family protein
MAEIWFISDTHFFHDNILGFKDRDGNLIRGRQFSSSGQMNEYITENWNERIRSQDKVYHLGDVAVGVRDQDKFTELMTWLNGHKRLLLGNNDHIEQPAYKSFERIELWTGGKFKQYNFVASHIPLRKDQMRDGEFNVHGHIHQNVMSEPGYINVCVEHTDYKPIHLDEIRKRIESNLRSRGERVRAD